MSISLDRTLEKAVPIKRLVSMSQSFQQVPFSARKKHYKCTPFRNSMINNEQLFWNRILMMPSAFHFSRIVT